MLTTADPDGPGVRAALAAGTVAALVPKPFDVDALTAAIARAVAARPRRRSVPGQPVPEVTTEACSGPEGDRRSRKS